MVLFCTLSRRFMFCSKAPEFFLLIDLSLHIPINKCSAVSVLEFCQIVIGM
jgi:hypothetical protein